MERIFKDLAGLKVLVTGGFGFIGSHLVKRLLECNAQVNVITRSGTSRLRKEIEDTGKRVEVYQIDLIDHTKVCAVIGRIRPMKVFHLAGLVNLERSFDIADACIRTNIQGTLNLLNALRQIDLDAFVFTSTTEVYGNNCLPFQEDQHEDAPSPYAISKLAGEHLCRLFQKVEGYPVSILRLSTVYGPCQAGLRLIPYVIRSLLAGKEIHITEGRQKRDFVYVEDAVDGLIRASLVKQAIGEVINLGHTDACAVREMVYKIRDLLQVQEISIYTDIPMRPNEQMFCACVGEKAKRILGWQPQTKLDEGLRATISWYAAHPPG